MNIAEDTQLYVPSEVVMENFGETYLVFLANQLTVSEINSFSKIVVDKIDGKKTVRDVLDELQELYDTDRETIEKDVFQLLGSLQENGVVKVKVFLSYYNGSKMSENLYLANPDVVIKEIDEDGAILYNMESEKIRAINSVGVDIWKKFQNPSSKKAITSSIEEMYESVTAGEIAHDVDEFTEDLFKEGFIGELLD